MTSKTARRLGGNVDSPNQSPLARIQISGLLRLENTWKYIAPPVDAQLKNICWYPWLYNTKYYAREERAKQNM